jgi:hypothetical protein
MIMAAQLVRDSSLGQLEKLFGLYLETILNE